MMEPLDTIKEIVDIMADTHFTKGSEHLVHVTHINHPLSFYVRIATLRGSERLLRNFDKPMTKEELAVGKIVIYLDRINGKGMRGRIQSIYYSDIRQGLACSIASLDNGWVDVHIPLQYIFFATKESLECPPMAVHCKLDNCESLLGSEFGPHAIHAMKFFAGKYTAKIIIKHVADILTVELRTMECDDNVSVMLNKLNFTVPSGIKIPFPTFVPEHRYSFRQLTPFQRFHVRVQSAASMFGFFVAEKAELIHYINEDWTRFTTYCENQPQADIALAKDGRACAVKMGDTYERAIVLNVIEPNARALVQLVDWGEKFEANVADIKIVEGEWTWRPALAHFCTIDSMYKLHSGWGIPRVVPELELVIQVKELGIDFRIPQHVNLCALLAVRPRPPPRPATRPNRSHG